MPPVAAHGKAPRETAAAAVGGEASRSAKTEERSEAKPADAENITWSRAVRVNVYIAADKRIETVPLETYVRGVVAGEMPADFEMEALKAQAVAARTYIVRKMLLDAGQAEGGKRKADVTAEQDDQVYVPLDELASRWPKDGDAKLARIARAVKETEGLILTYGGEPIQAAFFSTSNGYTENSEDYWSVALPYLRSVPSPWDAQLSPRFKQTIEMKLNDFYAKLGIKKKDRKGGIAALSRTEGRSIKSIRVGRKTFTGREAREKLGLPSASFVWSVKGDTIAITCFGYGHGVGMSQWGAQALAKAGNEAEQILAYYYRGAKVEPASKLPAVAEKFKT